MTEDIYQQLREWAHGDQPTEAAVELLIRPARGRFAQPGNPWIQIGRAGPLVDWASLTGDAVARCPAASAEYWPSRPRSGAVSRSTWPTAFPGLDRATLQLVLAAIAHAAGMGQVMPWHHLRAI